MEVTFKVSYHLDLKELAILLLKQPGFSANCDKLMKSQKNFEQKIRYYLWSNGLIDEDFTYTEEELNTAMDMIRQLYPSYEW